MSQGPDSSRNSLRIALAMLAVFFAAGALLRPVMPIDETRYLTVAWEMWLSGDYNLLTLNFDPYHHKPPLLFWLINLSWAVFGVSRWAAMVPVFIGASAFLWLTRRLTAVLLPGDNAAVERVTWLALGSAPFLIYSSLMMFDTILAAFVLGALLCFFFYARGGKWWLPLLAGLLMGCGGLTKGPVVLLYVLWPLLLYPFWRPRDVVSPGYGKWYFQIFMAILMGLIPVACWLWPLYMEADDRFLETLLWRQTAGRVSGEMKSAHARPFYFYLFVLPVVFVPWGFFRTFWSGLSDLRAEFAVRREFKFLLCWVLPVFLSFCVVSGKQAHYMVPLLPGVFVAFAWIFSPIPAEKLRAVTIGAISLLIAGHAVMSVSYAKRYDLTPVAQFVAQGQDRDWAFMRNYQGELGFLGRIEHVRFDSIEARSVMGWLADHPDGRVVIRRQQRVRGIDKLEELFSMPYRNRRIGIYRLPKGGESPSGKRPESD